MAQRLLFVITDLKIGGTPTVVRELAIRLRMSGGTHVEVACLSTWGPVASELRDAGVSVTAFGATGAASILSVTSKLVRLIQQHRIDTVLSFLVHANAVAALASRFCRGTRFFQSIQTTQPAPRWHWRVQALAQHAAARVIVPSISVADAAHEWARVPRDKIVVIPNAIDVESFARSRVPVEAPSPYPVGFIGRLDVVKRIPKLVRALHAMHQTFPTIGVHLHVFGEGADRSAIERETARLHMQRSVTLHGAIGRPHEALAKIGLLVLPSRAEGFGLVLIEAMAAGVPVIAADVAGIRDVVKRDVTGLLVDANDELKLAIAIMRVINDRALAARLIEAGLADVRERFSWASVFPRYQRVLATDRR